jgi:hypothetical protein
MSRAITSLLAGLLALSTAPAAPIPLHLMPRKEPLYFPTRLGMESRSLINGKDQGGRDLVTAAEEDNGEVRVTINGGAKPPEGTDWIVSPKGVFIARQGEEKYDPPLTILKLPHTKDAKWEVDSVTKGGTRQHPKGKFVARGYEDVEVPAGKFRAARVDAIWEGGTEVVFWFAPEVGQVKRIVEHANGGGFTEELKTFSRGK